MCKESEATFLERSVDRLFVRSTWLFTIFVALFAAYVFVSIAVLAESSSVAAFVVFSLFALPTVVVARVLRMNEAEEDWLGLDGWLGGESEVGVKAVFAVALVVLLVFAAGAVERGAGEEAELAGVAVALVCCAALALFAAPLAPFRIRFLAENEVICGVVVMDVAAVLMISRVGLQGDVRAEELTVLALFAMNVVYLEVDFLVKTREEESEGYDLEELERRTHDSSHSHEQRIAEDREEWLGKSVDVKRSLRVKILAHNLIIVAVMIPVIAVLSLRNALQPEEAALIALPVLFFSAIWVTLFHWLSYRGIRLLPSLLNNATRDLTPLVFAVVWNGVLAGEASLLPSLPEENRYGLFVLYAVCAGVPVVTRIMKDVTLRPRIVRQGGRKNDCHTHSLFRSALADTLQYYVEERPRVDREAKIQSLLVGKMRADAALVGFCYYEFCYDVKNMLSCLTYFRFDVTREPDYKDIEGLDRLKTPNVCCLNWQNCQVSRTDVTWLSFLLKRDFVDTLE